MSKENGITINDFLSIDTSSIVGFFQSIRRRFYWRFGKFKPCARYFEPMDELVIQLKDCSYTLDQVSRYGGILLWNYSEGETVVGFQLYGIRHFFHTRNKPMKETWSVRELVKGIAKETPGGFCGIFGKYSGEVEGILTKYNFKKVKLPPI